MEIYTYIYIYIYIYIYTYGNAVVIRMYVFVGLVMRHGVSRVVWCGVSRLCLDIAHHLTLSVVQAALCVLFPEIRS